jgi:hypothetical protein
VTGNSDRLSDDIKILSWPNKLLQEFPSDLALKNMNLKQQRFRMTVERLGKFTFAVNKFCICRSEGASALRVQKFRPLDQRKFIKF